MTNYYSRFFYLLYCVKYKQYKQIIEKFHTTAVSPCQKQFSLILSSEHTESHNYNLYISPSK